MAIGDAAEDGLEGTSPALILPVLIHAALTHRVLTHQALDHHREMERRVGAVNPAHLIPINPEVATTVGDEEAGVAIVDGVEAVAAKATVRGTRTNRAMRLLARKALGLRIARVGRPAKAGEAAGAQIVDEVIIVEMLRVGAMRVAVQRIVRLLVVACLSGNGVVIALRKTHQIALLSRMIEIHLPADHEDAAAIGGVKVRKGGHLAVAEPIALVPNGGGLTGRAIAMYQPIQL